MGIIAFLLDNIWLVVIVLFVVSRMLAKGGAGKQGQGPRMPSFGGGDEPAGPAQPMHQPAERAERREAPASMHRGGGRPDSAAGTPFDDRRGAQQSMPLRSERERPKRTHAPEAAYRADAKTAAQGASRKPASGPNAAAAAALSKEDIRKAVLWAEVLGPPRAKRPFRR